MQTAVEAERNRIQAAVEAQQKEANFENARLQAMCGESREEIQSLRAMVNQNQATISDLQSQLQKAHEQINVSASTSAFDPENIVLDIATAVPNWKTTTSTETIENKEDAVSAIEKTAMAEYIINHKHFLLHGIFFGKYITECKQYPVVYKTPNDSDVYEREKSIFETVMNLRNILRETPGLPTLLWNGETPSNIEQVFKSVNKSSDYLFLKEQYESSLVTAGVPIGWIDFTNEKNAVCMYKYENGSMMDYRIRLMSDKPRYTDPFFLIHSDSTNPKRLQHLVVEFLLHTLHALHALNSHHIFHGDLKEENIFLSNFDTEREIDIILKRPNVGANQYDGFGYEIISGKNPDDGSQIRQRFFISSQDALFSTFGIPLIADFDISIDARDPEFRKCPRNRSCALFNKLDEKKVGKYAFLPNPIKPSMTVMPPEICAQSVLTLSKGEKRPAGFISEKSEVYAITMICIMWCLPIRETNRFLETIHKALKNIKNDVTNNYVREWALQAYAAHRHCVFPGELSGLNPFAENINKEMDADPKIQSIFKNKLYSLKTPWMPWLHQHLGNPELIAIIQDALHFDVEQRPTAVQMIKRLLALDISQQYNVPEPNIVPFHHSIEAQLAQMAAKMMQLVQ